mgnify:CR=1 FL=1
MKNLRKLAGILILFILIFMIIALFQYQQKGEEMSTSFVKPVKHMKNVFRQNPCSAVSYRNLILFLQILKFIRRN